LHKTQVFYAVNLDTDYKGYISHGKLNHFGLAVWRYDCSGNRALETYERYSSFSTEPDQSLFAMTEILTKRIKKCSKVFMNLSFWVPIED
jgi:hypothetical protein